MKTQRFVIGLTLLNLVLVMPALFRANSAPPEPIAPVLRAHGLEIVDDQGKVRAMIKIFPADPNVKMPDGTSGYPETVLLRLINFERSAECEDRRDRGWVGNQPGRGVESDACAIPGAWGEYIVEVGK